VEPESAMVTAFGHTGRMQRARGSVSSCQQQNQATRSKIITAGQWHAEDVV
jgi:hypothetical protein